MTDNIIKVKFSDDSKPKSSAVVKGKRTTSKPAVIMAPLLSMNSTD